MATLTIKNIPDDLYVTLKKQAALHHRSINSEVIVCIETVLLPAKPNLKMILTKAKALREKTTKIKLNEKILKKAKNTGRP